MQVTRVSNTNELYKLTASWNCLTRGIPFRSWQWLFSWWKHYHQDRELYVLTVTDDSGILIGAAPFLLQRDAARGRVLRFLGTGEVCTDYLTILTTHEHQAVVVEAIARWLLDAAADPRQRWDSLELEDVAVTDTAIATLVSTLADHDCSVHQRNAPACWQLPLVESWESFRSASSKNRRRHLRRWERELAAMPDGDLQVARGPDDLRRGMQVLVDLHQRRRQSLGELGCFHSAPFSAFLHESAAKLLETGNLYLCWMESAGRPLAVEFNLLGGDALYMYQSGIDPEALDRSPGHLLTVAVLKQAISAGRGTYDFLRGDEPYKANWGATASPAVSYRVAANRWGPQLRHGVWTAGFAMKNLVKGGLTLTGAQ